MDEVLAAGLALLAKDYPALSSARLGERLEKYIEQLELYNPALGLVSVRDRRELVVKHILDSLAPLPALRSLLPMGLPRLADAGTGAGLPGIPLAIAMENISVTLLERMGRRVSFLHTATTLLGLANVDIEQTEVERALPGRFDLVTFRAFRPLEPPMLKALFRLLAPGGKLAAYKARAERVREEMEPIESLMGTWEEIEIEVPYLEEERRLVIVTPPQK